MKGIVVFNILIAIADGAIAICNFAIGNMIWGVVDIALCIMMLVMAGIVWKNSK